MAYAQRRTRSSIAEGAKAHNFSLHVLCQLLSTIGANGANGKISPILTEILSLVQRSLGDSCNNNVHQHPILAISTLASRGIMNATL